MSTNYNEREFKDRFNFFLIHSGRNLLDYLPFAQRFSEFVFVG